MEELLERLFPLASLVTPNAGEAALICDFDIFDIADAEAAALMIAKLGAKGVLVKGVKAELEGEPIAADLLFDGRDYVVYSEPWIEGLRVHGTGCVLASAIAANLASGHGLRESVERSRAFVKAAVQGAVSPGKGDPCAAPQRPTDERSAR
jgi:hydroxymethylpyrimidine/phosphomethylpyrimidine kinase